VFPDDRRIADPGDSTQAEQAPVTLRKAGSSDNGAGAGERMIERLSRSPA
jgi:hypothetical protein